MPGISSIPVVDLFAGPGGLGEGFSSLNGGKTFDIRLSIEMEANAYRTLELRSFVRQFDPDQIPKEYYAVMREPDLDNRERKKQVLFEKYQEQYVDAQREAWQCTLGGKDFPPELVGKRIDQALNRARNWILIGGPPCQAYSVVGRSRRQWKDNLDKGDHRVHLYKEYLRIIADHHPAVFVMENVKGLLSSRVDGEKIFPKILRDLRSPGTIFKKRNAPKYRIYSLTTHPKAFDQKGNPIYESDTDFLIKAELYGVPQKRHRVILLGIRSDIDVQPEILRPSGKVTLKEVINDLPALRSGINRSFVYSKIVAGENGKKKRYYQNEIDSNKRWKELITRFRTEIVSWNGFASERWVGQLELPPNDTGSEFIACRTPAPDNPLFNWYADKRLKGIANHQSRAHLVQDLKRYLFAGMYVHKYGKFPRMKDYASHGNELLPDHENAESGKFADRFRVQLPDEPATTVTSHISKDGHYFIHYDPNQCRSFTVREAARVQTFPDNYLFCGPRTAQYQQVGNAVPPYLANKIASIVSELFRKS